MIKIQNFLTEAVILDENSFLLYIASGPFYVSS